jgi:putative transposase
VIAALQTANEQYPAYGFSKLLKILRRRGHCWNHKRVHRIYCELNLNRRRRGKKRLPTRNPEPLIVPTTANQCWSMDFMNDALMCGRRFRTFNLLDDFNREALAIEIDFSLPAARVVRVLERVIAWRGYPAKLRMDNGPEFISAALSDWAERHNIKLDFIEPGTPTQNSFVERFNRTYREEILNMYAFRNLSEVREITEK